MKQRAIAFIAAAACVVAGCNQVRNEDAGYLVGGAVGGLVGSQIGSGTGRLAATAAGALLGAYVGGRVGRSMDETDRVRTSRVLESSPTGQTTAWRNPDTGAEYSVTPTRTSYASNGAPCRDFTTEAWIDGKRETIKGTACRHSDGTWRAL